MRRGLAAASTARRLGCHAIQKGNCRAIAPSRTGGTLPRVVFGNDSQDFDAATVVRAASAHVPPDFDINSDPPDDLVTFHDIGVVILESRVDVDPIPLLSPDEASRFLTLGAPVEIVGFGVFQLEPPAGGRKHSARSHIAAVGATEILIDKPGEAQNCGGDSGGPALLETPQGARIAGVVSRSADRTTRCSAGGIDTRVDVYSDWAIAVADSFGTQPSIEGGCATAPSGSSERIWCLAFFLLAGRRRDVEGTPRATRGRAPVVISTSHASLAGSARRKGERSRN